MPGQPAQLREVLGPADVHQPQVDLQARIELAAQSPGRCPQQRLPRRRDVEGGAAGDDRQAAWWARLPLPGRRQGAEEGQETRDDLRTQRIAAGGAAEIAGRADKLAEVAEEVDRAQRPHLLLRLVRPQPAGGCYPPGALAGPQLTEVRLACDHPARALELGGPVVEQPGRRGPDSAVRSGAHLRPPRPRMHESRIGVPDQDQSARQQQPPEQSPRGGGECGRPGVDDDEIEGTGAQRPAIKIDRSWGGQIRRRETRGRVGPSERLGQPPGLPCGRPEHPELAPAAARRTPQVVRHCGLSGVRSLGELRDAV